MVDVLLTNASDFSGYFEKCWNFWKWNTFFSMCFFGMLYIQLKNNDHTEICSNAPTTAAFKN